MTPPKQSPREFWINCFLIDEKQNDVEGNIYTKPPKHWRKIPTKMDFHVIEYQAYQQAQAEIARLKGELTAAREVIEFYGDKNKYFTRKRIVNLQETTAVFKVKDPSKLPTDYELETFECSVRLKVDQGKTAREFLTKYPRGE